MDRFIETCRYTTSSLLPYLKSNMDRFIALNQPFKRGTSLP